VLTSRKHSKLSSPGCTPGAFLRIVYEMLFYPWYPALMLAVESNDVPDEDTPAHRLGHNIFR
jgi:hypothetical protein